MNCKEIQNKVSLLISNELNSDESTLVLDHIKNCDKCGAFFSTQKEMLFLVKKSEEEFFVSELNDKIILKLNNSYKLIRLRKWIYSAVAIFAVFVVSYNNFESNKPNLSFSDQAGIFTLSLTADEYDEMIDIAGLNIEEDINMLEDIYLMNEYESMGF
ncbi:MAG: zf-HC2 domain-containing protein [Candidatus Delongbacteria bacterium]|nr:zf-HC2 domain-containing protein [Candidatus Delongbacteria bacterium]MBN2836494.1 zf-HC2 domain-containing protein [Candidatus Delongbacteria bacterium]